ncbi:MAG: hypothetical protein WD382_02135 [Halofilum sp. (in: g-proteobacteria)]
MTSVDRETLYKEVWGEPMTAVAKRYGVSSSYLARVCQRMNIPRPARGHWAKLAAGKPSRQVPLPAAEPVDELTWSKDEFKPRDPWPIESKPQRRRQRVPQPAGSCCHPLVAGASKHFDKVRETEEGYLRPYKRLLVDVYVSRHLVERVLLVADSLFREFEANGHRVTLAPRDQLLVRRDIDERKDGGRERYERPWKPECPTIITVDGVVFGLSIYEISESVEVAHTGTGQYVPVADLTANQARRIGWTTYRDRPTGLLCLEAYSPYPRTEWTQRWRESSPGDLEHRAKSIIRTLRKSVPTILALADEARQAVEEERRRWEAMQQQWERERIERQRAQAIKESRDELLKIIDDWSTKTKYAAFFAEVEARASELPEPERRSLLDRLDRARHLIIETDSIDSLRGWKSHDEREPNG